MTHSGTASAWPRWSPRPYLVVRLDRCSGGKVPQRKPGVLVAEGGGAVQTPNGTAPRVSRTSARDTAQTRSTRLFRAVQGAQGQYQGCSFPVPTWCCRGRAGLGRWDKARGVRSISMMPPCREPGLCRERGWLPGPSQWGSANITCWQPRGQPRRPLHGLWQHAFPHW